MDGNSLDLAAERMEQLKQIFPEVFSEGKVDFNRLKDILGENIIFANEHYELSWAGKAEARKEIQKQTTNTLTPALTPTPSPDYGRGESGNIFIEGENLEVLRILQKSYFGRIKMIYIDPPYNTGNDSFVYPDDYAERLDEYNKRTGVTDEQGYLNKQDLWRKNSRENGQFHSVWLSMMYPRLYLARNLLREDGVIFVSIDDNEVSNLKLMMSEIFGEENFLADVIWEKRYTRSNDAKLFASVIDHTLIFRKSSSLSYLREPRTEKSNSIYLNPDNDERGAWTSVSYVSQRTKEQRPNLSYKVTNPFTGEVIEHPTNAWKYSLEQHQKHIEENRLFWGETGGHKFPRLKKFLSELGEGLVPINLWNYEDSGSIDEGTKEVDQTLGKDVFDYPKPTRLIRRMLQLSTGTSDIILDFFAGSGTTAQAVLELNEEDGGNRKFICVQMPELLEEDSVAYKAGYRTIADICKARITKVIEKLQKARDEQLPLESKQVLGFRSFQIAPSNFKTWRGDVEGEELLKQLEFFTQSEKDGSLHENMLVELLLKSGLPLTAKVEAFQTSEVSKTSEVYLVESKLFIFFGAYHKAIKELIHEKHPQRVVCLDSAFKGRDKDISNFKLELKDAGIELTIL